MSLGRGRRMSGIRRRAFGGSNGSLIPYKPTTIPVSRNEKTGIHWIWILPI